MNCQAVHHRSPVKALFSSVFKREDISLAQARTRSRHMRSHSAYIPPSPTSCISSHSPARYPCSFPSNNHLSQPSPVHSFALEAKFADLQRQFDRMQEFYKTQVSRLTDEVHHYKVLYHKNLNYGRKHNFN
jgi:hypothetical protein